MTLIQRLITEADQCRNDGANDIANLLDEAVASLIASQAPAAPEMNAIHEVGWHESWRVGKFISSARRPAHILMLAVGDKQIAEYGTHRDFVRWVSA